MPTDTVSVKERGEYIRAAELIDPTFRDGIGGVGRYEGSDDAELTAALDIVVSSGLEDDLVAVESFGYLARVGPYVFQCDNLGFRDSYEATDTEWEEFIASEARLTLGDYGPGQ